MNAIFLAARAADNSNDPTRYTSQAAEGTTVITLKAGAAAPNGNRGRLYGATIEITSATQYWFMVFDSATAPTNGAIPIYRKRLTPNGSVDLPPWLALFGLAASLGLYVAISSTAPTLTLAAAADLLLTAHYK